MDLFEEYPYNFTIKSKNFIDQIIKSSEYKFLYKAFNNDILSINKFIYKKYLNGFISSSRTVNLISDQKFFNLFLASITMDRILSKYPNEIVFLDVYPEELNINSRFVNYYAIISKEVGNPFKIRIRNDKSNKKSFLKFDNSTKDLILKTLLYDFDYIKYFILNKFFKNYSSTYILSYGENLINREIKSELFKRKINTYETNKLFDKLFDKKVKLQLSEKIKSTIKTIIKQKFLNTNRLFNNKIISNAFIDIIFNEIINSLTLLLDKRNDFRKSIQNTFIKRHQKLFLSNGLFGLKGILLYDALKFNGYKVIVSEHGLTSGISKHKDFSYSLETNTSDVLFCYNKSSIRSLMRNSETKTVFYIVGAPNTAKKINFKKLLKIYLKKKMNLKGIQMLYLSGVNPVNSNKSFPTILPNSEIFYHNKRILKVLSKTNKNFSFKDYPTEQFLFDPHTHLKRLFGDKIGFLNKNVDFRYTRPAFDLIITNATQSTLEWCIGAQIPLVFLYDKKIMPLESKKLENIFKECFLFFDFNEKGWKQKLISFLNQPYKVILNIWKEKQKFRDQFDEEYFLSINKNAGKLGSNYLLRQLET